MRTIGLCLALVLVSVPSVLAQQTAGNLTGRLTDSQSAVVPGASVTALRESTGYARTVVSDAEGIYRLTAMPIGTYVLTVELFGFARVERRGVTVNVGQTVNIDVELRVASVTETVDITAGSPIIFTTTSSVGGVVDVRTIEDLPLNGRQFANLAITIPGVGLGFHSDPTKSTQFSPQINGGNGRNVNYQIDGGDNNDDTVGGLLQLFPLEAIQEFNVLTSRYKAEYGRSNGGVMNIITKSGTNDVRGSWFTLFRDDTMNARTETERLDDQPKQDYRRYQFGGSLGGPIVRNRLHYFGAVERVQQDTFQAVDTQGLFPQDDGIYSTPYRENLLTAKVTWAAGARQYLAVRYGRNTNSQPYNAGPLSPPSNWGDSSNEFNSINLNHNLVLGFGLNEAIVQYADFSNLILERSRDPLIAFPNGVRIGQNVNTPQVTQQRKWQFRDDLSWHVTGAVGLGHDLKTGVNVINQPHLYTGGISGTYDYAYTLTTNDRNGPVGLVTRNGGDASANIPNWQIGLYLQDDWRVSNRLTLNVGVRYDYLDGFALDQSKNPNFVILQNAGRAGRFAGQPAFREFGLDPKEDTNNWQGRAGFAFDLRGDGRDVARAGYGRYYDVGYTNSHILFAAVNATGIGAGQVFSVRNPNGIRKADGTLFHVGDPISTIASQNESVGALPLNSHIASPRIRQPYSDQYSAGWSHQLDATMAIDIDYVHSEGRDLGWKINLNQVNAGATARQFADLPISPPNFTIDISDGRSRYDGVTVGLRRRFSAGLQMSGWYARQSAKSTAGNGSDELNIQNIQNHLDPYADVQFGPSGRTDARHRFTISGIWQAPVGVQVSPIVRFRSALPVSITQGLDLNNNGVNNDIPDRAFAFAGFDKNGDVVVKDIGPCSTINCGRGAKQSQVNLRVSRNFRLFGDVQVEAIGEVFNLFNAKNPATFTARRLIGSIANPQPNTSNGRPAFLRPQEYAGDFQNPEQRIGQFGLRFTF